MSEWASADRRSASTARQERGDRRRLRRSGREPRRRHGLLGRALARQPISTERRSASASRQSAAECRAAAARASSSGVRQGRAADRTGLGQSIRVAAQTAFRRARGDCFRETGVRAPATLAPPAWPSSRSRACGRRAGGRRGRRRASAERRRAQVQLQAARVVDLRCAVAADAVDRPEHVGLARAARSGSRACTSRRCRPRAGCRRRPRGTSVGWKSWLSETRKSESFGVEGRALRLRGRAA